MADVSQLVLSLPDWLGAAVAGAAIAALGFVIKQILEWWVKIREAKNARIAKLKNLHSLLRATGTVFVIQADLRDRLDKMVEKDFPQIVTTGIGFEEDLSKAYPLFDPKLHAEHIELHKIIRGYTMYALKPLNLSMLDWLEDDTYFKSRLHDKNNLGKLANRLADLEAHLLLWNAKYEQWIPKSPEHCLVYMADEREHGLGFPRTDGNKEGIEELVEKVLDELA